MNLPNKLTVLRILLVPVIVIIPFFKSLNDTLVIWEVNLSNFIILIVFIIAALTDFLDGYLARKNNLITTFGKFLDPLADKLIVLAAILVLVDLNLVPTWIVTVIISREFLVTAIRLVAVSEGKVIAASNLGKLKTNFQFFFIIFMLIDNFGLDFKLGDIFMYAALVMTVVSGLDYFIKNRKIIFASM